MVKNNDLSKEQKMENVISRIVRDEIYSCQSGLVEMLINKGYEDGDIMNAGYYIENIKNYFINVENEENEPQEIFEWWLISNWLAEKLETEGEPILETDFGIYWGRTTTGQSISIDYVINKIAEK